MKRSLKPKSRENEIVTQKTNDDLLLFDLESNNAYCLNSSNALIYSLCDGTRTIEQITEAFNRSSKSQVSADFIHLGIKGLSENRLIEDDSIDDEIASPSRRDLIKKIGIASAVALPIIYSVSAPTAANAQSCVAPGGDATLLGYVCSVSDVTTCSSYCNTTYGPNCCSGSASAPAPCPGCGCFCT
ncbi:MAG: PqqD family protein [Pyrinomonadaceae bacterium]